MTERSPWVCPACGCGCAPHADFCGACARRQAFKPVAPAPTLPGTVPIPFIIPNPVPFSPYTGDPSNPFTFQVIGMTCADGDAAHTIITLH